MKIQHVITMRIGLGHKLILIHCTKNEDFHDKFIL